LGWEVLGGGGEPPEMVEMRDIQIGKLSVNLYPLIEVTPRGVAARPWLRGINKIKVCCSNAKFHRMPSAERDPKGPSSRPVSRIKQGNDS
jgi:hypothetical protein